MLNIKTRGTRESKNRQHFRYEATPYSDLVLLFEKIKLKSDDFLVDFGSGKGRVCFYSNYLFNNNVVGVEANLHTYHESLLNLTDFSKKFNSDNKINFHYGFAEEFIIEKNHNVFFFFNPFTTHIFKKVLTNITSSIKDNFRNITIILAFPIVEYVDYIINHTNFIVDSYIESKDKKNKLNKFLILRNQ